MNKAWTEDEILILVNFYPKYGSKYCASKLNGRSMPSIRSKAIKMGLRPINKVTNLHFTEENLSILCANSKCVGEILDKIGLRRAGGNYAVVKSYIHRYGIDVSHFITPKDRMVTINSNFKVNLGDILVENSNYPRSSLKRRLYDEGILLAVCSLCGQDDNWNGVKISLILDHINGIHNDNRIENLRIVCPNCNAGLGTFAGRNVKK